MSYNTEYTLTWKLAPGAKPLLRHNCEHAPQPPADFCSVCGKLVGKPDINNLVKDFISRAKDLVEFHGIDSDGSPSDRCSWYEHDKDMVRLSLAFPELLFTLGGQGEESTDLWKKYFVAGRLQIAKAVIRFEEFDPKKLGLVKEQ